MVKYSSSVVLMPQNWQKAKWQDVIEIYGVWSPIHLLIISGVNLLCFFIEEDWSYMVAGGFFWDFQNGRVRIKSLHRILEILTLKAWGVVGVFN